MLWIKLLILSLMPERSQMGTDRFPRLKRGVRSKAARSVTDGPFAETKELIG
jgi:hypothetical protein